MPGGKAFAGGLKMGTPLGAIYSTNITPDPETGIGNYTLEDFDRAVRKGVAKDGHRLYPAMPYPSYAKLTDADVQALYDFFMKEGAAGAVRPTSRTRFRHGSASAGRSRSGTWSSRRAAPMSQQAGP